MEENKEWKPLAVEKQLQFFQTLGSRLYDEIDKNDLFLLKKKVGYATCGKPSQLPDSSNFFTGYNTEELSDIQKVCDKIIEKSYYNPIHFSCSILVLYHRGALCVTSVFRIGLQLGDIFIDAHARVYQDWNQFMEKNKLPDCEYCYPCNGIYSFSTEGEALIGFAFSPASSLIHKATNCLDTAGSVASIAAASVIAAGFFVTVAPAAVVAAGTTATCTGLYSISRSVDTLVDRKKHEQSVGLKDQESRSAWMSLGSSVVGIASLGAMGKAHKVVESGKSLSRMSLFSLQALNASSLVFSGFGFVETLFLCADKYNKGILSKKDVFDLSCELLFLFNAIASVKATNNLLNNMSAVAEAPSVQKKLSKTQKRNLKKRTAKRRAKNLSSHTESDLISGSLLPSMIINFMMDALKEYAPRIHEILYNYQSIGHDIKCWRDKKITDIVFLNNLLRSIHRLYNDFRDDISEATVKVVRYFSSLDYKGITNDIFNFFVMASKELQKMFCTKIINLEDDVEALINDSEREVRDLYDELTVNGVENYSDYDVDDSDDLDGDDLNSESQKLLTGCVNLIEKSAWSCKDLEEFSEILEGVKEVVVSEYKNKVSDYKRHLKAAGSSILEAKIDVNRYNQSLGINGSVGQHLFTETLATLSSEHIIQKIKNKCKDLREERSARTTPIWKALHEGMFHYYGPHGSGNLSKPELLSIVNDIVTGVHVTENNCNLLEKGDLLMIEVSIDEKLCNHIVIFQGLTEDKTAEGIILVYK